MKQSSKNRDEVLNKATAIRKTLNEREGGGECQRSQQWLEWIFSTLSNYS